MLARLAKWLWQRPAPAPHAPADEESRSGPAARARFWAELRAGQREAELRTAALELGRSRRAK